ncbi:MAG: bacteriohemerythrin, partial [Clostridium sp.]
ESRITRAGADVVVYPLALGGEQISEIIASNYYEKTDSEHISFQAIDGYYIKKYRHFDNDAITIEEIVRKEKGLRAIALKPKSSDVVDNPRDNTKVFKDDYVIILLNYNMEDKNTCEEVNEVQGNIEWSDDYSLGNSSIDEEHLRLINLINTFNEALIKGESKNIINDIFDRLIEYTLEHFKNEEELLRQQKYPELEQHIIEHKKLINIVMDFKVEKDYIASTSVLKFLNMWLIEHIMNCDKKYKDYI